MKKLSTLLIFVISVAVTTFLAPKLASASTDVPLGFTGQDQHSGSLLDYGARYYDADLARFSQADKVDVFEMSGNPQDLNAYAYVKNNPVNATDPTGNVPEMDDFFSFGDSYLIPNWQMDYGAGESINVAPLGSEFPLEDAVELCCRVGSSLLPVDPIAAFDTGEYIGEGNLGMAGLSAIGIAGFGKWGKRMEVFLEKSIKTVGVKFFSKFVSEAMVLKRAFFRGGDEYGTRISIQIFGKEAGYVELVETTPLFFQYKIGKEYIKDRGKIYSAYFFVEPEFRQFGLAKSAFGEIGKILKPGDVHVINAVSDEGKKLMNTAIKEFGYTLGNVPGMYTAWKKY